MAELSAPRLSPLRPFDVDTVALLAALSPEQGDGVVQLIRERDNLFVLHHALLDVERAPDLEAKLRIFVGAIRQVGFARVAVTVRDGDSLDAMLVVAAGLSAEEEGELRQSPAPGEVWRRRLAAMERFRIGQSAFYLDGRDPWVVREFHDGIPSVLVPGDDPEWSPRDTLLLPLRGTDGRLLATLSLDDPEDRRRPTLTRIRTVELFGQQVALCIEQAQLVAVAERRAERLQRLQEVGSALARSLDEREIVRELARQIGRVLPSDAIVIAHPDLEAGYTSTALRVVRGAERPPRGPAPLGAGPIAEVARSGRPVRIADYDAAKCGLALHDDVAAELPPAVSPSGEPPAGLPGGSVLAVPMLIGIQLVGVIALHSQQRGAYEAEDEEVLRTIGAQAATALVNARLYAESQRERRQTEALADVARAVGESLRLGEVLRLILRHATALLRAEGGSVSLRTDDYLQVVAGVGSGEQLMGMQMPLAASMSGRAVRTSKYIISNDVRGERDAFSPTKRMADIRKNVIVPLVTARGAIGVLSVFNRAADFTDADARILQRLADHVAVAIVNARLFEEVAEATREWSVAFDAIAGGLVVLDAAGRITRSNARAAQLLEAPSPEALDGADFLPLLLRADPAETRAAVSSDPVALALGLGGRPPATGRGTVRAAARGVVFDVVASPHPSGGAVVAFDDVTAHHALAERYRLVVETANDAIIITDRDRRRIAFANPAARELFGAGEGLVGRAGIEFVPPDVADGVRRHEDRALAGEPQRYETSLVRPDGERRTVAVSNAPLRELGEVTGIVASLRDVTDERRARDAVTHSEARYRNLFETATDSIYTLDLCGCFTSTNEATCALVGAPRESLLGRSVVALLDPAEVERVTDLFRAARAGQSQRYECVLVRPDGERRQMSVTNTPIRQGREVVGVLGVARDVTVERARDAALARSEARYERLVESASDAIFTVDEELRFTSVNRALEHATGWRRDALLGVPCTEVADPQDREGMRQLLVATLLGERQRGELRYVDRAGEERWASIITAPVVEGERVTGALAVVRDVTEEKRLMSQLLQQEKLAAIGQLVSGVAHELNNPLAGVMAFSQILLASPGVDGEEREAAETIHQEAKRAAKIVSNLLTFARQHHPERAVTDVNRVLTDTLELRRYALRVSEIDIEVSLDPGVPTTWADPFQLQQVLLNLLGNAEQALDGWSGERRIVLRTWWGGGEGDPIVVAIGDSGPGIAPEQVARIFNPFYTTKPVGQGTGLGLSISDGIVREHGGRIRVESAPGAGATFLVELPRVEPPEVAVPPRH